MKIDRLMELEKAATPGPWAVAIESGCSFLTTGDYSKEIQSDGDLELAAEMRNQLPALLKLYKAVKATYHGTHDPWDCDICKAVRALELE